MPPALAPLPNPTPTPPPPPLPPHLLLLHLLLLLPLLVLLLLLLVLLLLFRRWLRPPLPLPLPASGESTLVPARPLGEQRTRLSKVRLNSVSSRAVWGLLLVRGMSPVRHTSSYTPAAARPQSTTAAPHAPGCSRSLPPGVRVRVGVTVRVRVRARASVRAWVRARARIRVRVRANLGSRSRSVALACGGPTLRGRHQGPGSAGYYPRLGSARTLGRPPPPPPPHHHHRPPPPRRRRHRRRPRPALTPSRVLCGPAPPRLRAPCRKHRCRCCSSGPRHLVRVGVGVGVRVGVGFGVGVGVGV